MSTLTTIDLDFQSTDGIIAAYAAPTGAGGFALFETGPASTVGAVERAVATLGFGLDDLAAIFVTHVHLDHSGAAGSLARRTGCEVWAHPAGAAHLIDPGAKLLPSAERIYGDRLEALWGRTEGVPSRRLRTVGHGERIVVGGLEVVAWHTPGHAVHHVAFQVGGDVVTGDVGGVRFPGADHVLPPMPPPDIDVEAWRRSLELLRGLSPERLLLTHFGAFSDPARHLEELDDRLLRWTAIAERTVARGGSRDELGAELLELDEAEIAVEALPDGVIGRYRQLCPMVENSAGLHRYVAKRAAASS
ncbi:MAG: MBL fold metallo-hydrolase [Thermoanaerobaculales bacterium]|jgi:glyoxylase-like metal-dependent hydrolase (beta-lactamase superfamily II)|nr:MBL fold metallo-hydrolase [Thermoanaerobaculales bacterium]